MRGASNRARRQVEVSRGCLAPGVRGDPRGIRSRDVWGQICWALNHSTPRNLPLCRWSEEFEGDVVGIAKCQTQPVVRFDDSAVRDAKLIQAATPLLQFGPITTSESQMVEAQSALVELEAVGRIGELVKADDGFVVHRPDHTAKRLDCFIHERVSTEKLPIRGTLRSRSLTVRATLAIVGKWCIRVPPCLGRRFGRCPSRIQWTKSPLHCQTRPDCRTRRCPAFPRAHEHNWPIESFRHLEVHTRTVQGQDTRQNPLVWGSTDCDPVPAVGAPQVHEGAASYGASDPVGRSVGSTLQS